MSQNQTQIPLSQQLDQIELQLEEGSYRPGPWQHLLEQIRSESAELNQTLVEKITHVSNKLHRRNRFLEAPTWVGYLFEGTLIVTSCVLLFSASIPQQFLAAVLLTLALQPSLKIITGLVLGLRYSYVYLWHFEPRFKMQYGKYLALPIWKKFSIQFVGCIGTPLALMLNAYALQEALTLFWLFAVAAIVATAMQIAAFTAAWIGIRRVGSFLLSDLTTPAKLAVEIRGSIAGSTPSHSKYTK